MADTDSVDCPQCHVQMTPAAEPVVDKQGVSTAEYRCPSCGASRSVVTFSSSVVMDDNATRLLGVRVLGKRLFRRRKRDL